MRIAMIFTTTLLFLSVNLTNANTIASQAFKFSSYGVMSYSETLSEWDAVMTWSDGTKETIQITDRGRIFLNGAETKGFGFVLKCSWSNQPSRVVANKMLDWCQDNGVRFMTFIIDADQSDDSITSRLDFWISNLYDHKMFMVIWLHPRAGSDGSSLLGGSNYKNKFKLVVDHIIGINRKEMIVAFLGGEEWNIQVNRFGITQSELQAWFNDVDPYTRNYLSTNSFDRPVGHAVSDPKHWASQMSLQYSDFVFQDWGIGSVYTSALDYHWTYNKEGWSDAGKSGYQAWLSSVHYGVNEVADNSMMTPKYFSHMLSYPELSAYFVWYLWEGWYYEPDGEEHYMFDLDGNPYYWTENLAPYFPH